MFFWIVFFSHLNRNRIGWNLSKIMYLDIKPKILDFEADNTVEDHWDLVYCETERKMPYMWFRFKMDKCLKAYDLLAILFWCTFGQKVNSHWCPVHTGKLHVTNLSWSEQVQQYGLELCYQTFWLLHKKEKKWQPKWWISPNWKESNTTIVFRFSSPYQ